MVPGFATFAVAGAPFGKVQLYPVIGEPHAVNVADGLTVCPAQTPPSGFGAT